MEITLFTVSNDDWQFTITYNSCIATLKFYIYLFLVYFSDYFALVDGVN